MRLRSQVEHAVLCCLLMIGLKENESLSTKSMATLYDLPKGYLAKALQALSRAGIIAGSHGIFGGYRLCRDPDAIMLLEIVEALEGPFSTFKQSTSAARLLVGAVPGVGSRLATPCTAADSQWRDVLHTRSLNRLAFEIGLSQEKIGEMRHRAIAACAERDQ